MELYGEIFAGILEKDNLNSIFPDLKTKMDKRVAEICYDALKDIKIIIENDTLSDFDCVERMGSNGGNRHDFG